MSHDVLLTVEEAAARLKVSKHTLNHWRVTGEGPPFVKYGPRLIRYIDRVLNDWAQVRLHGSTSEYERREAAPWLEASVADDCDGGNSTPRARHFCTLTKSAFVEEDREQLESFDPEQSNSGLEYIPRMEYIHK